MAIRTTCPWQTIGVKILLKFASQLYVLDKISGAIWFGHSRPEAIVSIFGHDRII
jgi:hypothetical protein